MFLLILLIPLFVLGIAALIFSIFSWRLRTPTMFVLGLVFTGILWLFSVYNYRLMIDLIRDTNLLIYSFPVVCIHLIPIILLVASRMPKSAGGSDSDVTDDYLNEIIEGPDSEI